MPKYYSEEITKFFGISLKTLSNWVRLSRDSGDLTPNKRESYLCGENFRDKLNKAVLEVKQDLSEERSGGVRPLVSNIGNMAHAEQCSKVGVVAPAYSDSLFYGESKEERQIECAKRTESIRKTVRDMGFNPHFPDDSIDPPIDRLKWSNTAEERTRHIINMLNDPTIEAIMEVNGGSGSIDVANLLVEYDKNPRATEAKIAEAWKDNHPEQEIPVDFFTPRMDEAYYRDSSDKMHGLPKRGIPFVGFSDGAAVSNVLGQCGAVRSYYGNPLETPGSLENIRDLLTNADATTKYGGLQQAASDVAADLPKDALPIHATILERLATSAGTDFQFHLDSPSILAIESISTPEKMVKMLEQARDSGMLDNVEAIVIGRGNAEEGAQDFRAIGDIDEAQRKPLMDFIKNSPIPFLLTDAKDTFGHGAVGITKSFANLAPATFTKDESGQFTLSIQGHASDEMVGRCFDSEKRPAMETTVEEKQVLEEKEPSKTLARGDSSAIVIDQETLRLSNGTPSAIDATGKICVISAESINITKQNYVHQAVILGMLSGSLKGAKGVILAIPPQGDVTDVSLALQQMSLYPPFKRGETDVDGKTLFYDDTIPTEEHARTFQGYLKNAGVDATVSDAVGAKGEKRFCLSVNLDEDQQRAVLSEVNSHKDRYSTFGPLQEMLRDTKRYMGDIHLVQDQELSQFKGVDKGARVSVDGEAISVATTQRQVKNLDALDLATMAPISPELRSKAADLGAEVSTKPPLGLDKEAMAELNEIKGGLQKLMEKDPKEKSHTQKMVDMNLKSPGGAREI